MKTFLIIVVLLLTVIVATGGNQPTPQTTVWEYKFEYKMNEKKANALGAEGWELTAIESTSAAGLGNNVPTYVFKRAK